MEVRLHARNATIDDQFRAAAVEKVSHAGRVFEHTAHVDVEVSEERNPRRSDDRFRIELTSAVNGRVLRIATAAGTPEAALDDAVDRFTHQLRRHKERLITSNRKAAQSGPGEVEPGWEEAEIVRTKQFVMKPLSVQEAALQMDLLGHDFFFFLNSGSEKQSVLYRRRDGRLGLIEPA